jgi:hypothetical protein
MWLHRVGWDVDGVIALAWMTRTKWDAGLPGADSPDHLQVVVVDWMSTKVATIGPQIALARWRQVWVQNDVNQFLNRDNRLRPKHIRVARLWSDGNRHFGCGDRYRRDPIVP